MSKTNTDTKKAKGRPPRDPADNLPKQVTVRFDAEQNKKLAHIDKYVGVGRAELIRRAVDDFIKKVEETGEVSVHATVPSYGADR